MAELAGSIVGLVGFAAKVSNLCYGYYGEVKDAPEDIKKLATEISSLAGLLERLLPTAEASKISQSSDSDWMPQLVHEFREILEELQRKLPSRINKQSGSGIGRLSRSLGARVIWPFKKEAIRGQIQKIERMKTTITLKLQL